MVWFFKGARKPFSSADNEFDTAKPGAPRPMTGLFRLLTEIQKRKVLSYKGAEYTGGGDLGLRLRKR
jgi:hypothetical protein